MIWKIHNFSVNQREKKHYFSICAPMLPNILMMKIF
jgi:hypothetical protein